MQDKCQYVCNKNAENTTTNNVIVNNVNKKTNQTKKRTGRILTVKRD
jgi:hypothetical protein